MKIKQITYKIIVLILSLPVMLFIAACDYTKEIMETDDEYED